MSAQEQRKRVEATLAKNALVLEQAAVARAERQADQIRFDQALARARRSLARLQRRSR